MTLRVENLHAAYGEIEVLHGVNLAVEKGQIIALLGANGAGKSTTIKAIMGLVKPSAGKVLLDGRDLTGQAAHLSARAGIALVPEGRRIFKKMTVEENLQVGGVVRSGGVEHRVSFGAAADRCTCPWWGKHRGDRGPCKHVLAARMAAR